MSSTQRWPLRHQNQRHPPGTMPGNVSQLSNLCVDSPLRNYRTTLQFVCHLGLKIQKLYIWDVSMMTPRRLHSILSLPCLQSLTLRNIKRFDTDDGETLTGQKFSVDELSVDGRHVASLWNLGLHTSCSRVQKLLLDWSTKENVSSNIVTMACSPFHHLTHLHIQAETAPNIATTLNDPVSFCDAVKTSCPRLTKLSLTNIVLTNNEAAEIIQLLKTHSNLTSIELNMCGTNADLNPLISEVNSEGKLTVIVKHGGAKELAISIEGGDNA